MEEINNKLNELNEEIKKNEEEEKIHIEDIIELNKQKNIIDDKIKEKEKDLESCSLKNKGLLKNIDSLNKEKQMLSNIIYKLFNVKGFKIVGKDIYFILLLNKEEIKNSFIAIYNNNIYNFFIAQKQDQ